jgi:hypothetical protein
MNFNPREAAVTVAVPEEKVTSLTTVTGLI